MTLRLRDDQRGFVISGIALLLILPAMLLAASCLRIIETGGETTSLQALSDKAIYTGYDIKRVIEDIQNNNFPIDNATLNKLAENYQAATGLLVSIGLSSAYGNKINIKVNDPRDAAQYSLEKLLTLSFQDFEIGNGTPGAYFANRWRATVAFESSIVHAGGRSVKMTVPAPAGGDSGATIAVYPASPSGYFDLQYAQTFSFWVYDTQGNNTVELKLMDGATERYLKWSDWGYTTPTKAVNNQWTKMTWDITPATERSHITSIEIYEYNQGDYYFDDLTFS